MSRKRLLLHARVQRVHSFCKCGYASKSKWRETVEKHQSVTLNHCGSSGPVCEVGSSSFDSWHRVLGVAIILAYYNVLQGSKRPSSGAS